MTRPREKKNDRKVTSSVARVSSFNENEIFPIRYSWQRDRYIETTLQHNFIHTLFIPNKLCLFKFLNGVHQWSPLQVFDI